MNNALKSWRTAAHLDAESAAKAAGVSLPTWSRWENGRRRIPAERVRALSDATGIPMETLRPDLADIFASPRPSPVQEETT